MRGYSTSSSLSGHGLVAIDNVDTWISTQAANDMLQQAINSFQPSQLLGSIAGFQQVANGLFQSEGTITARLRGNKVTPIFAIGQALSPESLILFTRLWFALGKAGSLIIVLSPNGRWVIRLTSES